MIQEDRAAEAKVSRERKREPESKECGGQQSAKKWEGGEAAEQRFILAVILSGAS
ncbi:hypothetical protein VSDG_06939 [Cytospora chrysosperma]|uniref:Uncharacterized protein n=1 Tax=Cytospora chrysosperma TaxID=252740 RepID=A0A423VRV8_CYTCH|nr:hypothetical protein VSDG_06939 [Valsa sordida]